MGCPKHPLHATSCDYHERLELALVEAHAALRDEGLVLASVTLTKNAENGFDAAWEADVRRRAAKIDSFTDLADALQDDGDTQA